MKKFTKILLAVAAMFAISCTTDATEDLGVNLNGIGQTEITLSLEASRTQLGEKAGDLYPLYWSEGDKISVNGVESSEAVISGENGVVASFSVAANTPYCIAYPAANAGQVVFADKQAYVGNNTFASGVSTMYAYSESGLGAELHHLTGVLKIGVTGSAKLVMAQVSNANRKPIAGAFDFDFVKGEAKATTASKEVIEYSFGEGVQLSSEPTYLHVAVPAGVYDELYVTLYDIDGGVMYATVKTDETKPLNAGKVREFSNNVVYTPTESVFVVKDVASLNEFAAQAATLDKDVIFVADVDMTDEAWIPIEGYAKTVRGNGYAVKGLTAPLFGNTNASFKGLHLTDVNITETTLPIVGALARSIQATDTASPIVEHCSASGKITVNCTEYEPLKSSHITIDVAGLVGYGLGVSFFDCKNGVELDVKQTAKTGNTVSAIACIGGICGFTYTVKRTDDSIVLAEFANCENTANINVVEKSHTGDMSVEGSGKFAPLGVWVGGICSSDYSSSGQSNAGARATNLVNKGNITVSAYTADCFVAGVMGNSHASTRENWENYGKITLQDSFTSRTFLAGIAGCIQGTTLTNATNYGEIEAKSSKSRNVNIAGVLALDKGTITGCVNRGTLNISHEIATRSTVYGEYKEYAVGGVVGTTSTKNAITDCSNYGTINVSGTIFNGNPEIGYQGVGGFAGVLSAPIRNALNEGTINVSVSTTCVAAEGEVTGNLATADFCIGGIAGVNRVNTNNGIVVTNNGAINVKESTFVSHTYIGGLVGLAYERFNGSGTVGHGTNNGNITIGEDGKSVTFKSNPFIAGCSAYVRTNHATDNDNNGTITINSGVTSEDRAYIGGVFGYVKAISTRCINNGDIIISGTYNNSIVVGGATSYVTSNYLSLNKNHGNITIKSNFECDGSDESAIGGIVGIFNQSSQNLQTSSSSGNITIEKGATFKNGTYVAGVAAYAIGKAMEKLTNSGDITIGATFNNRFGVAGCVAYDQTPVPTGKVGLTNDGNITLEESVVCTTDAYIGGVAAIATEEKALRSATNNGDITVSGTYDFNGRLCISGVLGWDQKAGTNTLTNTGDITIKSKFKCTQGTGVKEIAGCIGLAQATVSNAFNTGNITIEEGAQIQDGHYVGGCVADARSAISNNQNTGNITINNIYTEANNNYAGGVVGKVGGSTVQNVVSYCEMKVSGYANCGHILGSHRSDEVKITSGALGGKHYTFNSEDYYWISTTLSADNYYHYIYGSGEGIVWPEVSETEAPFDSVTFLTEKPVVPPVAEE